MLERKVDERADALDLDAPTIHFYPKDPRYRRSGNDDPQPGDITRCGLVKTTPFRDGYVTANCLMCIRLRELGR